MRCKTALATDGKHVLMTQQDLNTLAEEAGTRSFTPADAMDLLRLMQAECESIFQLYFPRGIPE